MSEDFKDYRFALDTLHELITDPKNKITYGKQKRWEIKESMSRGKMLENYRTEFLRENALEVVTWTRNIAESFNKKYPHDRYSVQDMIDVLINAAHIVKKHSNKN